MEGTIGPGLLETLDGGVHGLSGSSESAAGQHFDLLRVSYFGAHVDDLLSGFEELSSEVSELSHFAFDKGVPQLLQCSVDDRLIWLPVFEDALSKGMKGGLRTVAGSRSQLDREHRMPFAHSEVSSRAGVVEYKSHVFRFAFVIVCVIDGRQDAESTVGSVLDERQPGVCITRGVVDYDFIGTGYYNQGGR